METSITSEIISQQTICGDNEGLDADMETNKESIKFEWKQNKLSKAREIYFKYFSSQKKVRTKATVRKHAMMGLPLVSSIRGKTSKDRKGKTPWIGIKRLEKMNWKYAKHQVAGDDLGQECKHYERSADFQNPLSCSSLRYHSCDWSEKFYRENMGTIISSLGQCWHCMRPPRHIWYDS